MNMLTFGLDQCPLQNFSLILKVSESRMSNYLVNHGVIDSSLSSKTYHVQPSVESVQSATPGIFLPIMQLKFKINSCHLIG